MSGPNDGPSYEEEEDFATMLKRVEQSLQQQLRDTRKALEHNIEVVMQNGTTQKQSLEVANAKLRVVEQRTLRHSNEIKFMNRVVERHGLAEDLTPLRQQLVDLETKERQSSEKKERFTDGLNSQIATLESDMGKLHEGSKESVRLEMLSISSTMQEMKRDYLHFTCWARPLLEEFLPLPADVKDFHRDVADLRTRQERCEDDVNKIQRLGRILDDKVEVFDDLQRRMEELNTNARRVLGSQFATSVRCLCCRDDDVPRSPSPPPPTAVVNQQFEAQAKRRRPQSAGARLEQKREEKAKPEKQQMVFSVPRVRTDFPKQGSVVGIRGISIFKPPAKTPARRRPQSARACLQSRDHGASDPS